MNFLPLFYHLKLDLWKFFKNDISICNIDG